MFPAHRRAPALPAAAAPGHGGQAGLRVGLAVGDRGPVERPVRGDVTVVSAVQPGAQRCEGFLVATVVGFGIEQAHGRVPQPDQRGKLAQFLAGLPSWNEITVAYLDDRAVDQVEGPLLTAVCPLRYADGACVRDQDGRRLPGQAAGRGAVDELATGFRE